MSAARDVFRVAPAHPGARWIAGLARLELGQVPQAIDYLLAAVQNSDNAATWFDLAVALYRNNQHQQRDRSPSFMTDLFPTFLAATGGAPDPSWRVDGVNLRELVEDAQVYSN